MKRANDTFVRAGLGGNIRKGDENDQCGVGSLPTLIPLPKALAVSSGMKSHVAEQIMV